MTIMDAVTRELDGVDEYRKIVTDTYKSKRGDGDPVRRNQTAV